MSLLTTTEYITDIIFYFRDTYFDVTITRMSWPSDVYKVRVFGPPENLNGTYKLMSLNELLKLVSLYILLLFYYAKMKHYL